MKTPKASVPNPAAVPKTAAKSAPAKAPARKKAPALDAPQLYLNREMAFLAFDQRVLELDPRGPKCRPLRAGPTAGRRD